MFFFYLISGGYGSNLLIEKCYIIQKTEKSISQHFFVIIVCLVFKFLPFIHVILYDKEKSKFGNWKHASL